MTMTAKASAEISASPQEVLEFVLDLEQYKLVDQKIVRVVSVDGPDRNGRGSVKMWARMGVLPPALDRQDFTLERWHRLTFTGAARQPGRLVFDFVGTFDCQPANSGTIVQHAYEFRFRGPFRLIGRVLGDWLQDQLEDEVDAIKTHFAAQ